MGSFSATRPVSQGVKPLLSATAFFLKTGASARLESASTRETLMVQDKA
jgi:hypothetical protein